MTRNTSVENSRFERKAEKCSQIARNVSTIMSISNAQKPLKFRARVLRQKTGNYINVKKPLEISYKCRIVSCAFHW